MAHCIDIDFFARESGDEDEIANIKSGTSEWTDRNRVLGGAGYTGSLV